MAGPETEDLAPRLEVAEDPLLVLRRFATARALRLLAEAEATGDDRVADEAMLFWGAVAAAVVLKQSK